MKGSLLRGLFLVGLVGFGGGSALIPVVERELVDRRKLLSAEDYALLMGSLLLFGLLGTVMVLTRKLDWYGVGKRKEVEPLVFDLEAVQ